MTGQQSLPACLTAARSPIDEQGLLAHWYRQRVMGVKERYKQALEDWETLWEIAPASDMTGAYVDSEDLILLLKCPTKTTALECLSRQIDHWFQAGVESGSTFAIPASQVIAENEHLDDIARRHGFEDLIPVERRDLEE